MQKISVIEALLDHESRIIPSAPISGLFIYPLMLYAEAKKVMATRSGQAGGESLHRCDG